MTGDFHIGGASAAVYLPGNIVPDFEDGKQILECISTYAVQVLIKGEVLQTRKNKACHGLVQSCNLLGMPILNALEVTDLAEEYTTYGPFLPV